LVNQKHLSILRYIQAVILVVSGHEKEEAVQKNQKQQQYRNRNERGHADTRSGLRGRREAEEIVPGVPIIRSNTPRPSSFDVMISSTGYLPKSQYGGSFGVEKGALPRGFPAQAPSAPPLPEELEGDVGSIEEGAVGAGVVPAHLPPDCSDESQDQILGLSFAEAPSWTGDGGDQEDGGSSYSSQLIPSPLPLANPSQGSLFTQQGQQTASLPAFKDDMLSSTQATQRVMTQASSQRWLIAFSLYLTGLVLILLLLSVIVGIGVARGALVGRFTLLGVPWQVLIYGLLGGCISCIVSLSNVRASGLPLFIMITWFTRPFVGSILAAFSYVLLTSGLFMLGGIVDRHPGFFWLVGIFAGFCEWWLFCRSRG
jgi:hypothetical protein